MPSRKSRKNSPACARRSVARAAKPQRVEAGINLGLAVDSQRKDGSRTLVVPVIKNAAGINFVQFRAAYEDLVAKARDNKLTVEEQTGATFTLTNPGGIGTIASVPRLMIGQGTIVAAGAIAYPPGFAHAPDSTLKSLSIEKVMTMTSTYDHRIIQGAASASSSSASMSSSTARQLLRKRLHGFRSNGRSARRCGQCQRECRRAVICGTTRAQHVGRIPPACRRKRCCAASPRFRDRLGVPPSRTSCGVARSARLAAAGDPSLETATYKLTPAMMNAVPATVLRVKVPGNSLAEVLPNLRNVYSGHDLLRDRAHLQRRTARVAARVHRRFDAPARTHAAA